jgi:hypothetical protein
MINEGLIKLPAIRDDVVKFVLAAFLGYAWIRVHRTMADDKHTLARACIMIQAEAGRHDIELRMAVERMRGVDNIMRTFKFPDEVLYNGKVLNAIKVKALFVKQHNMEMAGGMYRDHAIGFITISLFNLHMTRLSTWSVFQAAMRKLPELITMIEHELTHYVQHKSDFHPDQLQMNSAYDEAHHDDYYLSRVEFDAMIRSSMGRLGRLREMYQHVEGFNEDELLRAAVCATPPPPWAGGDVVIPFFRVLKQRSRPRWELAVRKLTTAVVDSKSSK